MKTVDVFTPRKQPSVTYVNDQLVEKGKELLDALDMGPAVISLSGPSKSGKTVFIQKTIGKERLISIKGSGIGEPNILWSRVLDSIGTPISKRKTTIESFKSDLSGKITGNIGILKGQVGTAGAWTDGQSISEEFSPDYLQLVIKELRRTNLIIFIDDFHYIPKEIQSQLANQIKNAIEDGISFICASVPYRADDVIRGNPDLQGRIVKLDFNYWDHSELKKIAYKGFEALNIKVTDGTIEALANEAAGSPQLMQSLCLYICYEKNIKSNQKQLVNIRPGLRVIKEVCRKAANMTNFTSVIEKMKDGPKLEEQKRKTYILKDGTTSDVYEIVLKAIAKDPPLLVIRYKHFKERIAEICEKKVPGTSQVAAACAYMEKIANDADNRIIIEWDFEEDVLDIRDPYLLFYLRWVETQ